MARSLNPRHPRHPRRPRGYSDPYRRRRRRNDRRCPSTCLSSAFAWNPKPSALRGVAGLEVSVSGGLWAEEDVHGRPLDE